ncbi:hypothetical protein ACA910_012113 [Epithemia clementina (nom. ined.)]
MLELRALHPVTKAFAFLLVLLPSSNIGVAAGRWNNKISVFGGSGGPHRPRQEQHSSQQPTQQQQPTPPSVLSNRIGFVQNAVHPLQSIRQRAIDLRGGAGSSRLDDHDDDEEDDELGDDDLLDLEDDEDDTVVGEQDFAEGNTLDLLAKAWSKTPPVTKLFLQASLITTTYGFLFQKNEFPKFLSLEWKPILYKLQYWRLLTSFLNFGPFGIGYFLTAHFVWTYMATLERLSHNKPYDFWIMLLFGKLCMVIGYPLLGLSPRFLGHNLSTFLVYIWSRYHEGVEVNLFELFNTRAELLPWIFLAQTFLLEGELPILDFLGIVFGHIYHHCKTVGLLRAPPSLVTWYKTSSSPLAVRIRNEYKTISSDFEVQ